MNMLNEPGFTTSETTSPSSLLTNNLSLLSGAPNGIQKLRVLILELAVRGKLVPQDPNDEPARELLERIARGKKQLSTKEHSKKQKELTKSDEKPLFELPDGWVWARLGTLISEAYTGLGKGKSLQGSEYKYPYFKMNNILNKGGYDVSTMTRVNASDEEVKKYKLYPGDLLFNTRNSRELVGKSCVIQSLPEEIVLYNNNILRCNFFEGISAEVLDYWLRSSTGSQLLNLIKSNTTNVCAIYQGNLFELVCPVIPFKEQTRIVAKVNELMALCDRLEAQQTDAESAHARLVQALLDSLTQASDADDFAASWQRLAEHFHTLFTTESSIDALKQTLLQLAVMGKLVPQDPSDEPAAELLKHIAKEKSWLVAEGKSRKQKSLAEISDDEKLFKLPNGWEWSRLGSQVIDSGAGWSPSCEPRPREGKEWGVLKVSAVSWGAYKPEENKALPENLEARPEHEVLEGDFLRSV
ncbi:restriction endonuclease subunit S [Pseudomonas luteola]|uniref:restriction endonuclease subunit S n=1 Tax=Pseudomonas luteola TaxID=47886 RepID=UPI001C8BBE04|nr:restriction endonuclease subunit S [Pseudomonas luteola]